MKRVIFIGFIITLIGFLIWTPDTSHQSMVEKYGDGDSQYIDIGLGVDLHYRDRGDADKPVLLFIHGTSASLHTWEPLIETLGDRFRYVSFDLLGHGLTGATPSGDYSYPAQIKAVSKLMDGLSIPRATLVGNSLGGGIAWRAALSMPDRASSLVLFAPSGAPRVEKSSSNLGFRLLNTDFGRWAMQYVTPRWMIEKSLKQTISREELVNDEMVDRYWELLRKQGNRRAMADLSTIRRQSNAWGEIANLQQPSLIIWGEQDALLPVSMADAFGEALPNSQIEILPDIGHIPMEEAVERSASLLVEFCAANLCQ